MIAKSRRQSGGISGWNWFGCPTSQKLVEREKGICLLKSQLFVLCTPLGPNILSVHQRLPRKFKTTGSYCSSQGSGASIDLQGCETTGHLSPALALKSILPIRLRNLTLIFLFIKYLLNSYCAPGNGLLRKNVMVSVLMEFSSKVH